MYYFVMLDCNKECDSIIPLVDQYGNVTKFDSLIRATISGQNASRYGFEIFERGGGVELEDDNYLLEGNSYTLYTKALELRQCAQSWEPDATLIGNVKASEINAILNDYVRLKLAAGI